jgi:hypothetical protein
MLSLGSEWHPGCTLNTILDYQQMRMAYWLLVMRLWLQSVLSWQRARVASFLADSGREWVEHMKEYNSGTGNNQWMVSVPYSLRLCLTCFFAVCVRGRQRF